MTQPSELEKNGLLSQILNSPEFHDSTRYQELLRYLVDKSSKVTSLKETEIAHEVFGKDSKFDPSADPLIRSYISNLRKKLEHYYLTTDNVFEYKIEIPKGQYLVKYAHITKVAAPVVSRSSTHIIYPVVLAALIALFLLWEFVFRTAPAAARGVAPVNPIWNEFVENNGRPTLLVLGDYLLLSEKGMMDGRTFLRVPQINSEAELRDLAKLKPKEYGKYVISDVTYVGAGASMGIWDIMKAIGGAPKEMSIKLSSQLKWDDFDHNNIVYVGTFKTLDKLDTLFSRTNIKFSLSPNGMKVRNTKTDSLMSFSLNWHGGNYQKDYSIILKLRGSKDNSILFLTGFSELGVMESVKASVDPTLIARINTLTPLTIDTSPFLFELVSEVEGVRYTAFRSELKYFSLLPNAQQK